MVPNVKIGKNETRELVNQESYQILVGKLLYLNNTRSYISYVMGSEVDNFPKF